MAPRFELRATADGRVYFNLVARNGEVVATSVRFADSARARAAIEELRAAPIERRTAIDGAPYFVFGVPTGVLAMSELYSSPSARDAGIDAARRATETTSVVDATGVAPSEPPADPDPWVELAAPNPSVMALVVVGPDVELGDGRTAHLVAKTGHHDRLVAERITVGGQYAVTLDRGGRLLVWDVASGAELGEADAPGAVFTGPIVEGPDLTVVVGTAGGGFVEVDLQTRATGQASGVFAAVSASGRSYDSITDRTSAGPATRPWGVGVAHRGVGLVALGVGDEVLLCRAGWDAVERRVRTGRGCALAVAGHAGALAVAVATEVTWYDLHRDREARLGGGADVLALRFSTDGSRLVVSRADGTVVVHTFEGPERAWSGTPARRLSVDQEADAVLMWSDGPEARVELGAVQEVRMLAGSGRVVLGAEADERTLRVRYGDGDAVWDLRRGVLLPGGGGGEAEDGPLPTPRPLWWVADGPLITLRDDDRVVAHLAAFAGGWAVVDADGRFDSSEGGDLPDLYYVSGLEPIPLRSLADRYYDPGLLAKLVGHDRRPLRPASPFAKEGPVPQVTIESIRGGGYGIVVKDRGGGIGDILALLNRNDVTEFLVAGPSSEGVRRYRLDAAGLAPFRAGGRNRIEVRAANAAETVRARGSFAIPPPPADAVAEEPSGAMHAIVVGVATYGDPTLDLTYPEVDAEAFATDLSIAAQELLGEEHVHVRRLLGADGWSKQDLVDALAGLAEAGPHDSVVLYMAGHGVSVGTEDGAGEEFYFLTPQASGALEGFELRAPPAEHAVSGAELRSALVRCPALKRVMILDTCESGGLASGAAVGSEHARAMEQMKDRSGTFVLAGAAADQVSYEATRFGHGLLTYAVRMAIRSGEGVRAGLLDALRVGEYAVTEVPRLAEDIGSVQIPVVKHPSAGEPIPLGRVDDVAAFPRLAEPRVPFVRSCFQHEGKLHDVAGLGRAVDRALAAEAAEGERIAFLEVGTAAAGWSVAGRYDDDGGLVVQVALGRGGRVERRFTVRAKDAAGAVDAILAAVLRRVAKL